MTQQDFLTRVRGIFEKKASEDKRIQSILNRIESGKATFADTAEYSQLVSELLGSTLSEHLGAETTAYVKEYVCREMLRDQYENMNDLLASVQRALNEKVGLRVAPQRAAFPTERVQKVAHALEDPTVPIDVIKRRANAPVANVSKSFHDDYVKENAKFRSKAGLKCFIVRTTDGKCCDWCTAMAGRYVNGEEPTGFWNRHDNCGCTIYYNTSRTRQTLRGEGKKWNVIDEVPRKFVPKRFDRKEAKALEQAKLSQYRGLTNSSKNGRINYAKPLEMFNYSDIPDTEIITPKSIVAELEKSNIGKQILQVIETLPEPIRFTYGEFSLGIRGKEEHGQITIYLNNCKDVIWAARSVIHECTHYRYGIGQSQWAESVCVAQELKHARGRDKLTYEELKTIIRAVKTAYPEYNWRKGGIINGRRKTR